MEFGVQNLHNPLIELQIAATEAPRSREQRERGAREERRREEAWAFLAARGVAFPYGISLDDTVDMLRRFLQKLLMNFTFVRPLLRRFFASVLVTQRFVRRALHCRQQRIDQLFIFWCDNETQARNLMRERIQQYKRSNPTRHVLNNNSAVWRDYLQCRIPKALKMLTINQIYEERKRQWSAEWREYRRLRSRLPALGQRIDQILQETAGKFTREVERLEAARKHILLLIEPVFEINSITLSSLILRALEIEAKELERTGKNFYEPETSGESLPTFSWSRQVRLSTPAPAPTSTLLKEARFAGFNPTVARASSTSHRELGQVRGATIEGVYALHATNPRLEIVLGSDPDERNRLRRWSSHTRKLSTPGTEKSSSSFEEPEEQLEIRTGSAVMSNEYRLDVSLSDELRHQVQQKQAVRERRIQSLYALRQEVTSVAQLSSELALLEELCSEDRRLEEARSRVLHSTVNKRDSTITPTMLPASGLTPKRERACTPKRSPNQSPLGNSLRDPATPARRRLLPRRSKQPTAQLTRPLDNQGFLLSDMLTSASADLSLNSDCPASPAARWHTVEPVQRWPPPGGSIAQGVRGRRDRIRLQAMYSTELGNPSSACSAMPSRAVNILSAVAARQAELLQANAELF
eukprot:TRINITY_DN2361_c1_g2_i2.p1 TRINITY_DN2361_c1_g2~~TRINITY_DN2361_c1_g2_i2.p1  ORF type:complete len:638 (+),score=81.07 TRINITY_DN2361_c1_g2_i2:47-1960(+)